jgi:hypothetical protein
MRRWMPSVRRQPLRCNSSAVARTPGPAPALRALRWPPRLSQKYTRRDGVETRPYQRDERQSCGPPAPPAPLPRCGPCGGLHVCLRNTLGGTGLKPVPTNAMKDSRRPLLPSLTQPAGLKPVPTNAVKDRAAGRPHPRPRSRAAGLAVASTSVSEIR